jgi:hypothetical protein
VFVVSYGRRPDVPTIHSAQSIISQSNSADAATPDSNPILTDIAKLPSQGYIVTDTGQRVNAR